MALLALPRVVPCDGLIATPRLPREVPRGVQYWTGSTVTINYLYTVALIINP